MMSGSDSSSLVAVLNGVADILLTIDDDGLVRSVDIGNPKLVGFIAPDWIGRPLVDTLEVGDHDSIETILGVVRRGESDGARKNVTHILPDGSGIFVDYGFVRDESRQCVYAVGRDLSAEFELRQQLVNAQQLIEQDYWRIRQIEGRYRLLFELSSDAALIVEAGTGRILEANRRAVEQLSAVFPTVVGKRLEDIVDDAAVSEVLATLGVAARLGKADLAAAPMLSGQQVDLSVDLLKQGAESRFLVRMLPKEKKTLPVPDTDLSVLPDVLLTSAEAAVVCGARGVILAANEAFARLAELPDTASAVGRSASDWIGTPGVDLNILLTNTAQRGSVGMFATAMRGNLGSRADIEISASRIGETDKTLMLIRDLGRRLSSGSTPLAGISREVEQLRQRVGRLPLKELVRESTDVIEAMCIEAALELTDDNRAAAAELLGLSRQSLYSKMRRFRLGGLVDAGAEEDSAEG